MAHQSYEDEYADKAFDGTGPHEMPKSKFPMIYQEGKAKIEGGQIEFCYITSLGKVVKASKPLLGAEEIVEKTKARHARFKEEGPGTRESEESRAERKCISAHPEKCLKEAWEKMDEDTRMEFVMMLSMDSHYGISDPEWAEAHAEKVPSIQGDDGESL